MGRRRITIRAPLIDMKMMRIPAVWTTNWWRCCSASGCTPSSRSCRVPADPNFSRLRLRREYHPLGLILLPASVFMFIFGMLSGPSRSALAVSSVLITGLLVGIITFALLTFAHAAQWQILLAMVSKASVSVWPSRRCRPSSWWPFRPSRRRRERMNANVRTIGGSIGARS